MTMLDLAFAIVLSLGLSFVLIMVAATLARPIFLSSPKYIGNHKLSATLDMGQTVLYTLSGVLVGSVLLTTFMTVGVAAVSGMA